MRTSAGNRAEAVLADPKITGRILLLRSEQPRQRTSLRRSGYSEGAVGYKQDER